MGCGLWAVVVVVGVILGLTGDAQEDDLAAFRAAGPNAVRRHAPASALVAEVTDAQVMTKPASRAKLQAQFASLGLGANS